MYWNVSVLLGRGRLKQGLTFGYQITDIQVAGRKNIPDQLRLKITHQYIQIILLMGGSIRYRLSGGGGYRWLLIVYELYSSLVLKVVISRK